MFLIYLSISPLTYPLSWVLCLIVTYLRLFSFPPVINKKRCLVWFQSSWIYWILFFNLPYDVSMCSWVQCVQLLLDEMIYLYLLDLYDLKCSSNPAFPYWLCLDDLSFLKVHYLKSPSIIVNGLFIYLDLLVFSS